MKMRLYLCGPVSLGGTCTPEQEAANTQKFHDAERMLTSAGYVVESPVKIAAFVDEWMLNNVMDDQCPTEPVLRWHWYMRRTVIQMLTCNGVATLPNAELSRGCVAELKIAMDFGLPVKTWRAWHEAAAAVPLPNPMAR